MPEQVSQLGNVVRPCHRQAVQPKQNCYVGGNAKFYGAILFRFRERDFGEIRHVDGVSPAWPISYADLEPYYSRAEHLYHVHGRRGVDPPESSPCIRCATCDGYPCLVKGKADAHVVCVEPALRHPNVSLLTNAHVTRLETAPDGRTVSRVVVDRHGAREEYSADVVVVSCGAINSAALLLGSANDRHPSGLGNGSGVVGRNLMIHNNASLIAFSRTPNLTKFQKTLGVHDFYFGDGDWSYPLGAIQMNGKSEAVLIGFDAPESEDPRRAGPATRSTSGSPPRTCPCRTTVSWSTGTARSACATRRPTSRRTSG